MTDKEIFMEDGGVGFEGFERSVAAWKRREFEVLIMHEEALAGLVADMFFDGVFTFEEYKGARFVVFKRKAQP